MSQNYGGNLLIINGQVLHGTSVSETPSHEDVVVENGRIIAIGQNAAASQPHLANATIIDATNQLIIPGFVNSHYHSHDVLAKGTMEEIPLETWCMLALPPQYPPRSREEIKVRTMLGALECLKSGITTVQDMVTIYPFDPTHLDAVLEAYDEIGIRAVVALQYADVAGAARTPMWRDVFPPGILAELSGAAEPEAGFDLLSYLEEEYFSRESRSRLSWGLGPSTPEACTGELVRRTVRLSEKYDLPIFTHLYESKSMALQSRDDLGVYGGSMVGRMKEEGMLGPNVNLAHAVWILPDEIETLASTDTNVILNVASNLKLKCGLAPIREFQDEGVNIALGCDNSSANDSQNLFQVMKLTATLAAISEADPGPTQSDRVFHAATRGGARSLKLDKEISQIGVGFRADLVLIDLTDPTWVPLNSAVRQLVYAESGRGVKRVIVDGRVVIDSGVAVTIDEEELRKRVEAVAPRFMRDFAEVEKRIKAITPYLLEAHQRTWKRDVGMNRLFTGK